VGVIIPPLLGEVRRGKILWPNSSPPLPLPEREGKFEELFYLISVIV